MINSQIESRILLGMDWLQAHNPRIDWRTRTLSPAEGGQIGQRVNNDDLNRVPQFPAVQAGVARPRQILVVEEWVTDSEDSGSDSDNGPGLLSRVFHRFGRR